MTRLDSSASPSGTRQRRGETRAWCAFGLLLAAFLGYWSTLQPAVVFGAFYDDTIYFTTAQALAQGHGYVMPSVPGTPRQTKYPPLYPWLLSWVWRWNPSFPGNLRSAALLTAASSCWFLAASFQWLRQHQDIGNAGALALTALCAFHTIFLSVSRFLMSDMLFMALVLSAALAAERGLRRGASAGWPLLSATLAGAALLTRSLGVAVVLGFLLAGMVRRAWRQSLLFAAGVAPWVLALLAFSAGRAALPPGLPAPRPGFLQTWLYYTSYWGFWKLNVPDAAALWDLVVLQARVWVQTPAMFCLFVLSESRSAAGTALGAALSGVVLAGVLRLARSEGWQPLHWAFPCYSAVLLTWNYLMMDRALLLFLPMFYAGLWCEARYLRSTLARDWRRGGWGHRAPVTLLAGLLAVVAAISVQQYVAGVRPSLAGVPAGRASFAPAKQELYDWVRRHTAPDSRLVAFEDALLYLHTGRQGMWPLAVRPTSYFPGRERMLQEDLDGILDVALSIGARHWVMSADDQSTRWGPPARQRLEHWKSVLPRVFRSSDGRIEVYEIAAPAASEAALLRAR